METKELTELEQAEKDLRFYAAIIGHRPQMDASAVVLPPAVEEQLPEPILLHPPVNLNSPPPEPHKPHALRLWIRDMTSHARRRLDEAYHRLAS